jgi:integrase
MRFGVVLGRFALVLLVVLIGPGFENERLEAIPRYTWSPIWAGIVRAANRSLAEQYEAQLDRWERRGRRGGPQGEKPALVQIPEDAIMHDLRHFYASVLIKHRESVKTVQRRLGHSKPSITLDAYTHLWPDEEDSTRAASTPSSAPCPLCALLGSPHSILAGQSRVFQ